MKYTWKRHHEGATGFAVFKVVKDDGLEVVESGLTRKQAKTLAYRLAIGRVVYGKHENAMPMVGIPGHVLGALITAKQEEERENFQKNKFAIMAAMRENEREEAAPVNMKGWK